MPSLPRAPTELNRAHSSSPSISPPSMPNPRSKRKASTFLASASKILKPGSAKGQKLPDDQSLAKTSSSTPLPALKKTRTPPSQIPVKRGAHVSPSAHPTTPSPTEKPLPSLPVATVLGKSPIQRRSLIDATERPLRRSASLPPPDQARVTADEEWPALSPYRPALNQYDPRLTKPVKASVGESVIEAMRDLHIGNHDDKTSSLEPDKENVPNTINVFPSQPSPSALPWAIGYRKTKTSDRRLRQSTASSGDEVNLKTDNDTQINLPRSRSILHHTATGRGSPYTVVTNSSNESLRHPRPLSRESTTSLHTAKLVAVKETKAVATAPGKRRTSIPIPTRLIRRLPNDDSEADVPNVKPCRESHASQELSPSDADVDTDHRSAKSASPPSATAHQIKPPPKHPARVRAGTTGKMTFAELMTTPAPTEHELLNTTPDPGHSSDDQGSLRGYDSDGGFKIKKIRGRGRRPGTSAATLRISDSAQKLLGENGQRANCLASSSSHLTKTSDLIKSNSHLTKASDLIKSNSHLTKASDLIKSNSHLTKTSDLIKSNSHLTKTSGIIKSNSHLTKTSDIIKSKIQLPRNITNRSIARLSSAATTELTTVNVKDGDPGDDTVIKQRQSQESLPPRNQSILPTHTNVVTTAADAPQNPIHRDWPLKDFNSLATITSKDREYAPTSSRASSDSSWIPPVDWEVKKRPSACDLSSRSMPVSTNDAAPVAPRNHFSSPTPAPLSLRRPGPTERTDNIDEEREVEVENENEIPPPTPEKDAIFKHASDSSAFPPRTSSKAVAVAAASTAPNFAAPTSQDGNGNGNGHLSPIHEMSEHTLASVLGRHDSHTTLRYFAPPGPAAAAATTTTPTPVAPTPASTPASATTASKSTPKTTATMLSALRNLFHKKSSDLGRGGDGSRGGSIRSSNKRNRGRSCAHAHAHAHAHLNNHTPPPPSPSPATPRNYDFSFDGGSTPTPAPPAPPPTPADDHDDHENSIHHPTSSAAAAHLLALAVAAARDAENALAQARRAVARCEECVERTTSVVAQLRPWALD